MAQSSFPMGRKILRKLSWPSLTDRRLEQRAPKITDRHTREAAAVQRIRYRDRGQTAARLHRGSHRPDLLLKGPTSGLINLEQVRDGGMQDSFQNDAAIAVFAP